MRLNQYITELSMMKKPKIKYIDRPTYFHADIELDMEDVYQQSMLMFRFDCNLDALMSYMMSAFPVLLKAKEDLRQVITKINATTKEHFRETFDKVRKNFRTLYSHLFHTTC